MHNTFEFIDFTTESGREMVKLPNMPLVFVVWQRDLKTRKAKYEVYGAPDAYPLATLVLPPTARPNSCLYAVVEALFPITDE